MQSFGKFFIITGAVIFLFGLLLTYYDKIPFLGKLPGDITIKKENFTLYIPIVTCIILSLLISLIFYLVNKFKN